MHFKNFYEQLKQRNVFRVGTVYFVTGWLVIKTIDTLFPILQIPEWTLTLLTVIIILGFPFALIFAWAFELTPEGIKPSVNVEEDKSIKGQTGKQINRITIVSLLLIILFLGTERIFFAGDGSTFDSNINANEVSIAVLPFINTSADPDNEYFSDGLSEELLNALAQVQNLKVAGRTSSFKFKGEKENLKMIGRELGVNHILEGSVRKSGDRIRISTQLINVEDGYNMWSETYDRSLTDIFSIQEEISQRVLTELKLRLFDEENEPILSIPTQDLEAYQAYLRANHLMLDRQIEKMQLAIGLYEDAIQMDPGFAEAYARLAIAHHLIGYYGASNVSESQRKLKQYSERALLIDDQLGEAYGGLGLFYYTTDPERSIEFYHKSLELNENQPDVYNWLGNSYESQGRISQRNEAYLNAYEQDRLAPLSMYNRARVYIDNIELNEAESLLRKNLNLNPGFKASARLIGNIVLEREGRFDEALIAVHELMNIDNPSIILMAEIVFYAFELGMIELVEEYKNRIGEQYPDSREYGITSSLYSLMIGDTDMFENAILRQIELYNIVVSEKEFYVSLYAYVNIGGDPDRALAQFKKFVPALFADTLVSMSDKEYQVSETIMGILSLSGDEEQLNRVLEAYCDFGEEMKTYDRLDPDYRLYIINQLTCNLRKGQFEEAYPFYRGYFTEISPRFFEGYILKNSSMVENAMADPRYASIRDDVWVNIEDQRENVREYFTGLEGD